ncbi:hypothetical protein FA95DRAFT_1607276 [Auriscalpium vulgare]|uniref:Uncharacterized protein n=1 Tax=Auriscalpium vulgare TaxID=40419 RepID=A0ACB8RQR5_9AGAM|nr:hypothetical protein FA95DRAFT_1607276 [Auriscalpium vulgare]
MLGSDSHGLQGRVPDRFAHLARLASLAKRPATAVHVQPGSPWDKRKVTQGGTSFTPSFDGRPKTPSSSFPSLRRFTSEPSTPTLPPLLSLRLSSPSFLETVVHDGTSENPLYVIDTDDNTTKIRRSDARGFVNVARVRWRRDGASSPKDLDGVELAFGTKGSLRPADEFLAYSNGTISRYHKFYMPHHAPSLRWKRTGSSYYCSTESVKGPVAVLEPATLTTTAHLHIYDPLFRQGQSKPQRSHANLSLSLLDFLLVTALLILTPGDEWTNITRTAHIEPFPFLRPLDADADSNEASSSFLPPSPNHRASARSRRSSASDEPEFSSARAAALPTERWRAGATSSRAPSRGSGDTSVSASPITPTHYAGSLHHSAPRRTLYSTRNASTPSLSSHYAGRELPLPPPLPAPPSTPSRTSNRLTPLLPSSSAGGAYAHYGTPPTPSPQRSLPRPPTPGGHSPLPKPPPQHPPPSTPSRHHAFPPPTSGEKPPFSQPLHPAHTPPRHREPAQPPHRRTLSHAHAYGTPQRAPALPPLPKLPGDDDAGVYATPAKFPQEYAMHRPALGIRTALDGAEAAAAAPIVLAEVGPRASVYELPPPAYSAVDVQRSRTASARARAAEG